MVNVGIDAGQFPDTAVLQEDGPAGIATGKMSFLRQTGLIEERIELLPHDARDLILAPALDQIARPQFHPRNCPLTILSAPRCVPRPITTRCFPTSSLRL